MGKQIKLSELIAPPFYNTFFSKVDNQIDLGGRGSTKTSKNAIKVVFHTAIEQNCSAIVLRKNATSLRNSVYKEIKRACQRLGLIEGVDYRATLSPMSIMFRNKNTIYFSGCDDYEKLKGMIDENAPIKIVWFEELTEFTGEDQVEQIKATFARGNNDYFISLYTFNPPNSEYHWVNTWVKKVKNYEDYSVTKTDYRGVPADWLGIKFINTAENLKKRDINKYKQIYLGEVHGNSEGIYNMKLIKEITELEEDERIYAIDFAIDSGHQVSATTCLAIGVTNKKKFILLDTYYYSPNNKEIKKAPSQLSADINLFIDKVMRKNGGRLEKLIIDSAEGALRNQLYLDNGWIFKPVNKEKKETMIDNTADFLSSEGFYVMANHNNNIFLREMREYQYDIHLKERGIYKPDKTEKKMENEKYINSYSMEEANTYGDHTCDAFSYWVISNK